MKAIYDRAKALVAAKTPRLILPGMGDARVDAAAKILAELGYEIVPVRTDEDLGQAFLAQKPSLASEKVASY